MDAASPIRATNGSLEMKQSVEHIDQLTEEEPNAINGDPHNPVNWPEWKKNIMILMISFHSMVSVFSAAGLIPAYEAFAKMYNVELEKASYLTSAQILLLGVSPIFWIAVTQKFGRHYVLLLSVLASLALNIAGAKCTTYASQMATRVLTAFFISPPIGIGSGVVVETCRPEQRARKLGWWVLMTILGTPAGPFLMGFVVTHAGVQWTFWTFAIINFVQVLGYIFLGDETLYSPPEAGEQSPKSTTGLRRFFPRPITPRTLDVRTILAPLLIGTRPRVLIPALATAITFCYANIVLIVEMPISFGRKFDLDAQQTGLQFLAVIIGCVLGEQIAGPASDYFMKYLARRRSTVFAADRLWLSYVGFLTIIAGLLVWGFQLDHAAIGRWNVTPCVGVAIASFGNQIQSTILTTYAVDSHSEEAAAIGVFFNLIRLVYGFIGPFYFPYMFETLGFAAAAGVMSAIVVVGGMAPAVVLQFATSR